MDSLSEVSAYMKKLENMLDDGESAMKFSRYYEESSGLFLGEMRIDITMLKEDKDVDTLLANLMEDMVEVRNTSGELIKIDEVLMVRTRLAKKDHTTMTIDDGVIKHTYYPKPRAKVYLECFEIDEDEDWLGCYKVGCDEDGNLKYSQVAPSFLDIKDEMERALTLEAYFNPFKNIIVFKKPIHFLGSLPIQLKNVDWGSKGCNKFSIIGLTQSRVILAEYLCKKASGMKENSETCGGYYVTKIAKSLGHYVDEELDKCSDLIKRGQYGALGDAYIFTGAMPSYGGNSIVSSLGYEIGGSSRGVQANDDDDDDDMSEQMVCSNNCVESDDDMDD
nr:hypothetical protein [Tanacetum cinerariifolium]